jgi:nucleotide-binding universal stress UspA family protein
MRDLRERVVQKARRAGQRAANILRRRWPGVKTMVVQGDPRVEIVHVAEQTRADMVALGARGLGPLKRLLVGSTSLAVARYAPCAVAIIRERPRKVRHVLVAVDDSGGCRAALDFLSTFGLVRGRHLSLVHVLPPALAHGSGRTLLQRGRQAGGDRRRRRVDVGAMLAAAAARFPDARHPIERWVTEGDPAREIVRRAHDRDVDLVVLGARGLRTLGRLLLGSVSETVLHHAGRPVLIVQDGGR